jgi:hypothetical protein
VSAIDALIAELAEAQHGVVALRQLRGRGVSDKAVRVRLADQRLHPLFRGVFVAGRRRPSLRGRWLGATLALGDDALLSHRDAAVLLGLAREHRPRVDVTVPARTARSRPGVRAHRSTTLTAADRTQEDAIPVTSVPRTMLDNAALVDEQALRRMYAKAERAGILDVSAFEELLARSNGHRGFTPLAALIDYDPTRLANADSVFEIELLELLERNEVPPPLANVLVAGHLVDVYWPSARLVVELDGFEFHRDREAFERDRRKLAELRRAGYEAVAFTWRQLEDDPGWVLETIAELLERGRRRQRAGVSL